MRIEVTSADLGVNAKPAPVDADAVAICDQPTTVPPLSFLSMIFEGKGIDWRTPLYGRVVSNPYLYLKGCTNNT